QIQQLTLEALAVEVLRAGPPQTQGRPGAVGVDDALLNLAQGCNGAHCLLEPRQVRMWQRSVSNVHLPVLSTTPQRGNGLAGIEQAVRVKRFLDSEERCS